MATIVNNPGPGSDNGGNAAAWIVGLLVLVLIVLGAIFVWPKFANMQPATTETQTTTTTGDSTIIPPVVNNYTTINASTTVNGTTTAP